MTARAKQANTELQEDRERWLLVFSEDCTAQELQELKPPFVFSIYLKFAKIYLGASLDNMKLMGLNCPRDMQMYPEVYEKSILMPKVAKLLSWFFSTRYGNTSFSFEDLISATPERARLFFNYIVDFVYDFTEWQDKVEQIIGEVEQRKKGVLQLEDECNRLTSNIDQLRKQKAEAQIAIEEEQQLKQAVLKELQALKENKVDLKHQFEAKREQLAQVTETGRQADAECETLGESVRQLEACVVSAQESDSFKQLEQQLRDGAADLADKRQQLSALEQHAADMEQLNCLIKTSVLVQTHDLEQQVDQLSELTNTEALSARRSRAGVAYAELDDEFTALQQRVAHLEQACHADLELRSRAGKGIEADIEAAREMLSQQQQADERREVDDKQLGEQLEETEAQLQAVSREETNMEDFFSGLHTQLAWAAQQHTGVSKAALQQFINEMIRLKPE